VKHRNDCRLARQVLVTGHPEPKAEWAASYIRDCGTREWAASVSAAARRMRSETDSATLVRVWGGMSWLQDAAVFRASLDVAQDQTASTEARLWAVYALSLLADPAGAYSLHSLVRSGGGGRPCIDGYMTGPREFYMGEPLPVGYRDTIKAAGRALSDASDPRLRTAGACLANAPTPRDTFTIEP
jgi:hypothetical protein